MNHMSMWITCILFIVITYISIKFWFFHCYLDQPNLENIQQKFLSLIIACFHPNVDFVFLYQFFWSFFMNILSLGLHFYVNFHWKWSFLDLPHFIEPIIITWSVWDEKQSIQGIWNLLWKTSITSSWKKTLFTIIISIF